MEISGTQRVQSPAQAVWDALNNPAILARCIPGCTSLVETQPDRYSAEVALKVGPVSARFQGKISLEDKQEPTGCRIVGSGSGGAAGFAKGAAVVRMEEADGATSVIYDVEIETGGKIASLGARMMRRVIDSNMETFFERLSAELSGESGAKPAVAAVAVPTVPTVAAGTGVLGLWDRFAWFGAGVGAALVVLLLIGKI